MQLLSRITLCAIFCSPVFASPVEHAIINGWKSKRFRAAVRRDDDLLRRGEQRETYLHLAAAHNRDTHLNILLKTPLRALLTAMNIHGQTAIEVAIMNGNLGAFNALLPFFDPDFRIANKYRWSLVHLAARSNAPRIVVALYEAGADINAVDGTRQRWTPLDVAEFAGANQAAASLRELGAQRSQ